MPLYIYLKAKSSSHRKSKTLRLFSLGFVLIGIFMLGQVIIPIAGWYVFVLPSYQSAIISPLPSDLIAKMPLYPSAVLANELVPEKPEVDSFKPSTYTISIPKLKIESAIVKLGDADDDLKKSLLALPAGALPGSYGNTVIFGHSALPQVSSPKSYGSIFTFLMDLKIGDKIYVDADGVNYKYEVIEKMVVEPTDLSVISQRYDSSYLTLITCVPPGTTWKRGVVIARIVPL